MTDDEILSHPAPGLSDQQILSLPVPAQPAPPAPPSPRATMSDEQILDTPAPPAPAVPSLQQVQRTRAAGGESALIMPGPGGRPLWQELAGRDIEAARAQGAGDEELRQIIGAWQGRAGINPEAVAHSLPGRAGSVAGAAVQNAFAPLEAASGLVERISHGDAPATANIRRNIREDWQTNPEYPIVNAVGSMAGFLPWMLPAISLGGAPAFAAQGAVEGAGNTILDIQDARGQGQQISGDQELGAVLGNAATRAAVNYVLPNVMSKVGEPAANLGAQWLGPTLGRGVGRALGAVAGDTAVNEAIAPIQTAGENLVARQTYDPNRSIWAGVPESLQTGWVQGLAFAPMTALHAGAEARSIEAGLRQGFDPYGENVPQRTKRPNTKDAIAAEALAKVGGSAPVWFAGGKDAPTNGFVANGRAYLNADNAGEALSALAAHELQHALRRSDPRAAYALDQLMQNHPTLKRRAAADYLNSISGTVKGKQYARQLLADPDALADEAASWIFQQAARKPEFIQQIYQANPALAQRVAAAARSVFEALGGSGAGRLARQRTRILEYMARDMGPAEAPPVADKYGLRESAREPGRYEWMDALPEQQQTIAENQAAGRTNKAQETLDRFNAGTADFQRRLGTPAGRAVAAPIENQKSQIENAASPAEQLAELKAGLVGGRAAEQRYTPEELTQALTEAGHADAAQIVADLQKGQNAIDQGNQQPGVPRQPAGVDENRPAAETGPGDRVLSKEAQPEAAPPPSPSPVRIRLTRDLAGGRRKAGDEAIFESLSGRGAAVARFPDGRGMVIPAGAWERADLQAIPRENIINTPEAARAAAQRLTSRKQKIPISSLQPRNKEQIRKKLIAWAQDRQLINADEAHTRLEDATGGSYQFRFRDRLPGEVKALLEGPNGVRYREYFRVARPGESVYGEDAVSRMGGYAEAARAIDEVIGGKERRAIEAALKSGDPEAIMWARALQEGSRPRPVATTDLKPGDRLSVGERGGEGGGDIFRRQLDDWRSGILPTHARPQIGRPSEMLAAAGIPDRPIEITQNALRKAMTDHGLTHEDLRAMPEELAAPVMVFKPNKEGNGYGILTTLRTHKGDVVVAVKLNVSRDHTLVHDVATAYGHDASNIAHWILKGNLLVSDREKAEAWVGRAAPANWERHQATLLQEIRAKAFTPVKGQSNAAFSIASPAGGGRELVEQGDRSDPSQPYSARLVPEGETIKPTTFGQRLRDFVRMVSDTLSPEALPVHQRHGLFKEAVAHAKVNDVVEGEVKGMIAQVAPEEDYHAFDAAKAVLTKAQKRADKDQAVLAARQKLEQAKDEEAVAAANAELHALPTQKQLDEAQQQFDNTFIARARDIQNKDRILDLHAGLNRQAVFLRGKFNDETLADASAAYRRELDRGIRKAARRVTAVQKELEAIRNGREAVDRRTGEVLSAEEGIRRYSRALAGAKERLAKLQGFKDSGELPLWKDIGAELPGLGEKLLNQKLRIAAENARRVSDKLAEADDLSKQAAAIAGRHNIDSLEREVKAAIADPRFKAFFDAWNQHINPYVNDLWTRAQLGPLPRNQGKYTGNVVNLVDRGHISAAEAARDAGEAIPVPAIEQIRSPRLRDRFEARAAGTGDYTNDPERALLSMLRGRKELATRYDLLNAMARKGVGVWKDADQPAPAAVGGIRALAVDPKYTSSAVRKVFNESGDLVDAPQGMKQERRFYVREDLYPELMRVLGYDALKERDLVRSVGNALTKLQVAGVLDAVYHSGNLNKGVAVSARDGALGDLLARIPGVGTATGTKDLAKTMWEIHEDTPGVRATKLEMARLGLLRGHYRVATDPVSRLQEMTTGKAIELQDEAARVVMYRRARELQRRGVMFKDDAEVIRLVQSLGEYNRRLLPKWAQVMKGAGLSPFVVAGRTFNRLGRRLITGNPGFKAANTKAAVKMRLLMWSGPVAAGMLGAFLNYARGGNVFGRPGTPLGAIDTGADDERGRPVVIDLLQLSGARRGMRQLGIEAAFQGIRQGKDLDTTSGNMLTDMIASSLHPWFGPAPAALSKAATGRNVFDIRGRMEARDVGGGGRQYLENARAALESQNPLIYNALVRPMAMLAGADSTPEESYLAGVAGEGALRPLAGVLGYKSVPVGQTAAMDLAMRQYRRRFPDALTPEEKQTLDLKGRVRQALTTDPAAGRKLIAQAIQEGTLTRRQAADLVGQSQISNPQSPTQKLTRIVKSLDYDTAEQVYAKATTEESALEAVMGAKRQNQAVERAISEALGDDAMDYMEISRKYNARARAKSALRNRTMSRGQAIALLRENPLTPAELLRYRRWQRRLRNVRLRARRAAAAATLAST